MSRDNAGSSARIRVLVVDDQPPLPDAIWHLLSSASDLEVTSENLSQTPGQLRSLRPDVILLGGAASVAGNQKVFAAIREGKLPARVIMIAQEGGGPEDCVEAVLQGCCGIVRRQTSRELLLKSIRQVHAGEFWLDRVTTATVISRLAKKSSGKGASSRPGIRDRSSALSRREREIVVLAAQGFKNKEMAERMVISEQTVKNHLHSIFDKLGVSDRLELALYAIHHDLYDIS
jgi:two-component system nitrate/nitrite response regulator NarL